MRRIILLTLPRRLIRVSPSTTTRLTPTSSSCTTWTPPSPASSPWSAPWRFTPTASGWVWSPDYVRDATTWQQRHKPPHQLLFTFFFKEKFQEAIPRYGFIFQLIRFTFPSVPWSHWRPGQHDGGLQCRLHCLLHPGESPQDRSLRLEGLYSVLCCINVESWCLKQDHFC